MIYTIFKNKNGSATGLVYRWDLYLKMNAVVAVVLSRIKGTVRELDSLTKKQLYFKEKERFKRILPASGGIALQRWKALWMSCINNCSVARRNIASKTSPPRMCEHTCMCVQDVRTASHKVIEDCSPFSWHLYIELFVYRFSNPSVVLSRRPLIYFVREYQSSALDIHTHTPTLVRLRAVCSKVTHSPDIY